MSKRYKKLYNKKGILQKVTEQVYIRKTLAHREATLRSFYENIPMMMGIVELHENDILHLSCNHNTALFYGTSVEKMKEVFVSEFETRTEVIELWLKNYREALNTQNPVSFEVCYLINNDLLWLSAHVCLIVNQEHAFPRFSYLLNDITEQKKISEALSESEGKFRGAFEASSIGKAIVGLDNQLKQVNDTFCNIVGYSRQELSQLTYQDITHPDDLQINTTLHNKLLMGEIPGYAHEKRYIHKDGRIVCAMLSVTLVRNTKNDPLYFVSEIQDISDQKRTEQELNIYKLHLEELVEKRTSELKQSEDRLQVILDTVGDGIIILNNKGLIQSVNPPIVQMFGYSQDELTDKDITYLIDVENKFSGNQMMLDYLQHLKVSNITWEQSLTGTHKNGQIIPIEVSINSFNHGNDHFFSCVIRDITARKNTETELNKLYKAVQQSPATVVIANTKGIIEYVNPKFEELTGYTADEAIGRSPNIVKSGRHGAEFYRILWTTIRSGQIWRGEFCNKKKNGELYWESASIAPVRNENEEITHFVAVKENITDKIHAAEDLRKAKEAAETANQAKSVFLANMSHEIRTPMNAILGFSKLIQQKVRDEQILNYLSSIVSSGNSLLSLINDILDLSKIEAGKMDVQPEFVNLNSVFKDIKNLFSLSIQEKGLDFITNYSPDIPKMVLIDDLRLRQIMINLIGNAIKFTRQGFVKFEMNAVRDEHKDTVTLQISISDSGIGIKEDAFEEIFTSFNQQINQSTKKYGGTGLGLTISKKLIELLQGEIKLESIEGKGSKFSIIIPGVVYSDTGEEKLTFEKDNQMQVQFYTETVLIADDIEQNRKLLTTILKDLNLKVLEAKDGMEALEICRHTKPRIIITDLKMPGIDGYALLKRLRLDKSLKNIPVIASTASLMGNDMEDISQSGFDGFIQKPLNFNQLITILSRFLEYEISPEARLETDQTELIQSNPENVTLVVQILNDQFISRWKHFEKQQPLHEVTLFAEHLRKLGQEYGISPLIVYGYKLKLSIDNFDIDEILKLIQDFPKLILQIQSL